MAVSIIETFSKVRELDAREKELLEMADDVEKMAEEASVEGEALRAIRKKASAIRAMDWGYPKHPAF